MKEIPLTQGKVAIVDDEDYEALTKWKWCYHKNPRNNSGYAVGNSRNQDGKRITIRMHRVILDTPPGYETDHVNGNGLDNRKDNLRVATHSQNKWNTDKPADNTSGYKGVSWDKRKEKWQAQVRFNNKYIHLGRFKKKLEAAIAYNKAAIKYHGEFFRQIP